MLDHLSLQCDDVEASLAFYLDVFAPSGIAEVMRYDGPHGPVVGLGSCTNRGCGRSTTRRTSAPSCENPDGHHVEAVCHTGE